MSDTSIPIGSIVAYCGPVATDADKAYLKTLGWLLCDGEKYLKKEYPYLALSIANSFGGSGGPAGYFNVPDLRGRFLRGTAHGSPVDPDASSRGLINIGGAKGDSVGSLQVSATALPKSAFETVSAGNHSHSVPHGPINNNAYAIAGSHYGLWNTESVSTDLAGDHTHALISGWDSESRPINLYVNFLIKFQDE